MAATHRVWILKAVRTALVLTGAAFILPSLAEAQSRGSLQVSATVVDTKTDVSALEMTRTAIAQWANPKTRSHVDVPTLAQVSVALRPANQQLTDAPLEAQATASAPTLVVRIDYVNN